MIMMMHRRRRSAVGVQAACAQRVSLEKNENTRRITNGCCVVHGWLTTRSKISPELIRGGRTKIKREAKIGHFHVHDMYVCAFRGPTCRALNRELFIAEGLRGVFSSDERSELPLPIFAQITAKPNPDPYV